MERNRVLALAAEMRGDWRQAQDHWDARGRVPCRSNQTPDARLAQAVVLRHLADLAQHHPDAFGDAWARPGGGLS